MIDLKYLKNAVNSLAANKRLMMLMMNRKNLCSYQACLQSSRSPAKVSFFVDWTGQTETTKRFNMSLSGTSARSLPAELRSPPDAVPLPQVHKGAKYDTWWILLQHPLILLQHPLRRRLILYSIHQHTDTLSHWTLLQHPWDVIRDHDRNDNISLHFTKLLLQIHA